MHTGAHARPSQACRAQDGKASGGVGRVPASPPGPGWRLSLPPAPTQEGLLGVPAQTEPPSGQQAGQPGAGKELPELAAKSNVPRGRAGTGTQAPFVRPPGPSAEPYLPGSQASSASAQQGVPRASGPAQLPSASCKLRPLPHPSLLPLGAWGRGRGQQGKVRWDVTCAKGIWGLSPKQPLQGGSYSGEAPLGLCPHSRLGTNAALPRPPGPEQRVGLCVWAGGNRATGLADSVGTEPESPPRVTLVDHCDPWLFPKVERACDCVPPA